MDPLKAGLNPLTTGGLPMTDEVQAANKKARVSAGMESSELDEGGDVGEFSEAATKAMRPKFEKFLDDVKAELMEMDRDSETFLPDATSRLVGHAFHHEFGEEFTKNPGYPQMEAVITRHLLNDPEYREQVEDFMDLIHAHVEAEQQAAAEG